MVVLGLFWSISGVHDPSKSGGFAPRPIWQLVRLHLRRNFSIFDLNKFVFQGLISYSTRFLFVCRPVRNRDGTRAQAAGGLRNRRSRPRVWIVGGRFGTVSEHVRGSRPPQSRGASPPDPSRNLWVCTQKRFFRFLTLRNQRFRVSISYSEVS